MADCRRSGKVITVELRVSMHCKACGRDVKRALSKLDGVESVSTDMEMQKVSLTGRVDPRRVMKELKKKTGKRVELWADPDSPKKEPGVVDAVWLAGAGPQSPHGYNGDDGHDLFTYFSDENPNACVIV